MVRLGNDKSGAEFSDCNLYRFSLWRTWTDKGLEGKMCCFIGLNPSTATHELDDPTIRRCVQFSKDWGFDGYMMLNLFAFRATEPADMKAQQDQHGAGNDSFVRLVAYRCGGAVCAWGVNGEHLGHGEKLVRGMRSDGTHLYHLGLTKHGFPKHPLYLKSSTKPILWESK